MKYNIFWFRRDLRLDDNVGLHHALNAGLPVKCLFIFDEQILRHLPEDDARVEFIHRQLVHLRKLLQAYDSDMKVVEGTPVEVFKQLAQDDDLQHVFTNKDYEVYAKERDAQVREVLHDTGVKLHRYKDHVIFDDVEVMKDDGSPYVVFTPYKRRWLARLDAGQEGVGQNQHLKHYSIKDYSDRFLNFSLADFPSLSDIGFKPSGLTFPEDQVGEEIIRSYDKNRDYPAREGTSRLSVHLRFGTISIRQLARRARGLNETFLSELIWRDFYSNILNHFPHVEQGSFREKYDLIDWINDEDHFQAWCDGKTGYPMVDAGMRELNETGFMHNRVRMITSSFLTKHLLIHWSWGERYFAEKLLDYDLASNNGGWQWAAGSGTDAAPYFRVFNPTSQFKKFDPQGTYVKKWVPEWGTEDYPDPIVDHKEARQRALDTYKKGLA